MEQLKTANPGRKRKSDYTPEAWAAHLEYMRQRRQKNLETERARLREYNQRPEVKARRKAHDAKPHVAEKRLKAGQTAEAKKAASIRHKTRMTDNPEVWAEKLAIQREKRTGFSPDLYHATLEHQGGLCAVCQRQLGKSHRACADHCHDTKMPRGILCHHCNILEGMLRGAAMTPKQWAVRMADYLANPPAQKLLHG